MSRHCLNFLLLIPFVSCNSRVKVIVDKYPNGNPTEIRYFNNIEDSKKHIHFRYLNGVDIIDAPINFTQEVYYDNGQLNTKGDFFGGYTSGLWEYYNENGSPQAKCYYREGKSADTAYCFDSIGRMKRFMFEIDTTKGIWNALDYYPNGKKKERYIVDVVENDSTTFISDGPDTLWYDNGNPRFQVRFQNDTMIGMAYFFNENGDTLRYFNHYHGNIDLPYKKWLDNGLTLYGNYTNKNENEVLWQWFNKSGKEVKKKIISKIDRVSFVAPD